MKYLLLIYSNPTSWAHPVFMHQSEALSDDERNAMLAEHQALIREITESGELIGLEPLAAPVTTRTVRAHHGVPVITDGPFAESKEQLAGYAVLDCESLERALAIAARFPDTRFGPIEVRPIMDMSGLEM